MRSRQKGRMLIGILLAAAGLALTACAGLPTSGDVNVGLELGKATDDRDYLPFAPGPAPGASPAEIVEGFMEAGITTSDNWSVARSFLTPELQQSWRPATGVSVDTAAESRRITPSVSDDEEQDATTATVQVSLDQVASVDENGAYAESSGASSLTFALTRLDNGQWRIAKAQDGIVVDQDRFTKVFDQYALQYFDHAWSRLVPDVRWFPRSQSIATSVTRALIDGVPSPWLDPAVQTAFPADVQLAQDAVPIDTSQVADVALTRAAATLDATTLARMRTQLQETLKAAGVRVDQVNFTVNGRSIDAGLAPLASGRGSDGSVVLTDNAFGTIVGEEVTPIAGISEQILRISEPMSSIDVATDDSGAAVQLADGRVFLVSVGKLDQLDAAPTLISPSLDQYGYTWTVPRREPTALQAWGSDVRSHPIAVPWAGVSEISHLRVAADGARVAAIVTVGGQRWVAVAAVIRNQDGVPVELGPLTKLTMLDGDARGLVWLGPTRVGVLFDPASPQLLTQMVGGPGTAEAAPVDAVSVAGARGVAGVRMLDADGALFAHAGSAWREVATGVRVLATRAGE